MKSTVRYITAFLAGAMTVLAFAPYDQYWLAVLMPALLFILWQASTARSGFFIGWCYGVGLYVAGINWLYISIHDYGYVNAGLAVLLIALLVSYLALFPAISAYLVKRIFSTSQQRFSVAQLLLVIPSVWTLLEWLRGILFSGFPWLQLGYSQIDGPLRGLAPIVGVYGVTFVTVFGSGLLVLAYNSRVWQQRIFYVGTLTVVVGFSAILSNIHWTEAAGDKIDVSLIQGGIPQDIKWMSSAKQPTIDLFLSLTEGQWDSDLIIWPETAYPDFYHRSEDIIQSISDKARSHETRLITGLLHQDQTTRRYHNSMVILGGEHQLYHKRHLVPFTEYLPLKDFFGPLVDFMQVPMSDFEAGNARQQLFDIDGQRIGASICFEDVFGEEIIRDLPEAALLVNLSNDGWFGDSIAQHQHLQIARMRAVESGRPMLRATNNGISAIIGPDGSVAKNSPRFVAAVVAGSVYPMKGATPYVFVGNYLIVCLSVLLLLIVYARQKWLPNHDPSPA